MMTNERPLQFRKKHDGCWQATYRQHLYRIIRTCKGDWYGHVFPPAESSRDRYSDHSCFRQKFDDLVSAKQILQELARVGEFK